MCSLDPTLVAAPLDVQIQAMRDQLEFLKSLDDAPLFGPGVLQMDGDIGESSGNPSQGLALHQPAAPPPPPPPPGRGLRTKSGKPALDRPQSTAVSLKKAPPMPPSFGRGIHRKGAADSLNAQELWEFTYRTADAVRKPNGDGEQRDSFGL